MKVRVILVCTLLLLAAVPSFALPLCAECTEWNTCDPIPGSFERCKFDLNGFCFTTPQLCTPPRSATVLTEWQGTSVEISRPSQDSATVTASADVAEVPAAKTQAAALK